MRGLPRSDPRATAVARARGCHRVPPKSEANCQNLAEPADGRQLVILPRSGRHCREAAGFEGLLLRSSRWKHPDSSDWPRSGRDSSFHYKSASPGPKIFPNARFARGAASRAASRRRFAPVRRQRLFCEVLTVGVTVTRSITCPLIAALIAALVGELDPNNSVGSTSPRSGVGREISQRFLVTCT